MKCKSPNTKDSENKACPQIGTWLYSIISLYLKQMFKCGYIWILHYIRSRKTSLDLNFAYISCTESHCDLRLHLPRSLFPFFHLLQKLTTTYIAITKRLTAGNGIYPSDRSLFLMPCPLVLNATGRLYSALTSALSSPTHCLISGKCGLSASSHSSSTS